MVRHRVCNPRSLVRTLLPEPVQFSIDRATQSLWIVPWATASL